MHKVAYDRHVMTGDQLRNARVRAKMTRQELADRVGASLKSIGNWERSKVPPSQEPLVRGVLFSSNPLEAFTHWELLSEVGQRMDRWLRALADDELAAGEDQPSAESDPPRFITGRGAVGMNPSHDTEEQDATES